MLQRIASVLQVRVEVLVLVETSHGHLYLHQQHVWGNQSDQVSDILLSEHGLTAQQVYNLPAPERDRAARQYWVARGKQPHGSRWVGFCDEPVFLSVNNIPHRNLHYALEHLPE
ncbi:MAG TPA: hypothetical protein VKP88_07125 [Candidatus Paceibacterota bacterium]|nr:hypothetical protein [Candidatus Paceibacterota bacterium]